MAKKLNVCGLPRFVIQKSDFAEKVYQSKGWWNWKQNTASVGRVAGQAQTIVQLYRQRIETSELVVH
ncbi:MAG: hypothetical protein KDI12_19045 [Anaerolineae bacterium]|nr:hypothetical protein [Anaerolineae bacterium]MCB0245516.1 hypothetical protein [Anaerolineae bacterium]